MWTGRFGQRVLALTVVENILIGLAVMTAVWLRPGGEAGLDFAGSLGLPKAALIAAIVQFCLYCTGHYDARSFSDLRHLFLAMAQGLGAATLVLAVLFFWVPSLMIGRGILLFTTILIVALVGGWRVAGGWLSGRKPRERLLLVGTGPQAVALARELFERRVEFGVEIVGFIDPDPAKVGTPLINPGVIGVINDIPAIARERLVSRVVVSVEDARGKLPMDKLLKMKLSGVQFDHLASVYEEFTGKIAVENLRPSWFVFSNGFRKKAWVLVAKRMLDVVSTVIGLTVGAPIMLLVAAAVKLTSRGPVFYHQRRVGQYGRVFVIHKIRSMRADAEDGTGAVWATKGDSRVTPIGRFLRQTRLDEMPQLWNVLVGEMSLVGPRPERPEFVDELTQQIPFYGERHQVKPGVTGWAQVRYSYGASVEDALEKLQYDLFYVKNLTISLDLMILFSTVKTVLLGHGA